MNNTTVTNTSEFQVIPVKYFIAARINSALILLENISVLLCLSMNKRSFYKQEFWLLLVCLTLNDILCGITMMFATFIQSDALNQSRTLCIFLLFLVQISQMSMMLNVLSICIYRLILIVCADKLRFGWKIWMSVVQIAVTFVFSCVYCSISFLAWARRKFARNGCDVVNVFGDNMNKAYFFVFGGLLLPLLMLNIMYVVTILLLRRMKKRNSSKCLRKLCSRKFMTDSSRSSRKSTNNKGAGYDGSMVERQDQQANNATRDTDICEWASPIQVTNQNLKSFKHSSMETAKLQPQVRKTDENLGDLNASNDDIAEAIFMKQETHNKNTKSKKQLRNNDHRQCLVLIGVILAGINITTWPAVIISGIEGLSPTPVFPRAVTQVLFWLVFNNSLINPWLYTAQSSEFRAAVRRFWEYLSIGVVCKDND